MERLLNEFEVHLSYPEQYLSRSDALKECCLTLNQKLFGHCNSGRFPTGPLSALHTKGFDNDQIWEQVQLLNQPTVKYAKRRSKEIAGMAAGHSAVLPQAVDDDKQSTMELLSENSSSSDEYSRRTQASGDRFFNISEMNQFLLEEDRKFESSQDHQLSALQVDDFDLFRDMSSADECDQLMYNDFFDPPNDGENHDLNDDHNLDGVVGRLDGDDGLDCVVDHLDDDDGLDRVDHLDDDDDGGLDCDVDEHHSTHQKHQQKLKNLIKCLEDKSVAADKPWQLTGEVTSQHRPVNSLLEEVFTFDHMTRTTPTITEEATKNLEDIIKQRVIDEAWDDVERKVKPVEKPFDYARSKPLDQEKSSMSLAEIYEQEFLKQTKQPEDKEDERHTEIKELMYNLFHKLDGLSNFHFTPKPPKPDIKVVVNVPLLAIEEVTPSFQNDTANLLAPEEIEVKNKSLDIGQSEKTKTDKFRERRKKKRRSKMIVKSKTSREKLVSRLNVALGNKFSKTRALNNLQAAGSSTDFSDKADKVENKVKSSKMFFEHLQEEVAASIKSKKTTKTNRKCKQTKSSLLFKL